jgi:hypothetical protein
MFASQAMSLVMLLILKAPVRERGRIEIPRDLLNGTEHYFGVEIER